MSCCERDDLGVSYVHRKVKETKRRQSTNEEIRGIDVRMMSTSPSKQTTSMSKEQNRAMRKKDRNTSWRPPRFVRLHPLIPCLRPWRILSHLFSAVTGLLVAGYVLLHPLLHLWLHPLPADEGQHPPDCPSTFPHSLQLHTPISTAVGWLDHRSPAFLWLWFSDGHGQPWSFEGGNSHPMH